MFVVVVICIMHVFRWDGLGNSGKERKISGSEKGLYCVFLVNKVVIQGYN